MQFRPGGRKGYTRVEVMAAAVAGSLLVGVVAPTLGGARGAARITLCEDVLKGIGLDLMIYTTENEEWFPGVNTTGVNIRAKQVLSAGDPEVLNDSALPVQNFDWMTPLAAHDLELPENRAERWQAVWDRYRCPAQTAETGLYCPSAPDCEDFAAYDWTATSYLMPVHFSYWGTNDETTVVGTMEGPGYPIHATVVPSSWEVTYADYRSRLGYISKPARKVFVADGTRYVMAGGSTDIDVTPYPVYFGAFTTSGTWWPGGNAYGVKEGSLNWDGDPVTDGSVSEGLNLLCSYRHPGTPRPSTDPLFTGDAHQNYGGINALAFDGHLERLHDRTSREIDRWYPSGAVVQQGVGMTTEDEGFIVP